MRGMDQRGNSTGRDLTNQLRSMALPKFKRISVMFIHLLQHDLLISNYTPPLLISSAHGMHDALLAHSSAPSLTSSVPILVTGGLTTVNCK